MRKIAVLLLTITLSLFLAATGASATGPAPSGRAEGCTSLVVTIENRGPAAVVQGVWGLTPTRLHDGDVLADHETVTWTVNTGPGTYKVGIQLNYGAPYGPHASEVYVTVPSGCTSSTATSVAPSTSTSTAPSTEPSTSAPSTAPSVSSAPSSAPRTVPTTATESTGPTEPTEDTTTTTGVQIVDNPPIMVTRPIPAPEGSQITVAVEPGPSTERLPRTGAGVWGWILAGTLFAGIGALAVLVTRRRVPR